mmetsp:Transcript_21559/g.33422  ORF Transcript_21559/g.33422 Transcript_21559/m.33422 type:complete len:87 (-) Transcript_21559:123-383(-)
MRHNSIVDDSCIQHHTHKKEKRVITHEQKGKVTLNTPTTLNQALETTSSLVSTAARGSYCYSKQKSYKLFSMTNCWEGGIATLECI